MYDPYAQQPRRRGMVGGKNMILMLWLVYGVIATVLFFNAYAVPFTTAQVHSSLQYWAHSLTATTVLALLLGMASMIYWTRMMLTFVMGLLLVLLLMHGFVVVILLLDLVSCSSSVQCADNALCDGTFVGPYAGASGTFILAFVCSIAVFAVDAIVLYLVYSQRRWMPPSYGGGAAQYPVGAQLVEAQAREKRRDSHAVNY